MKKQNLIKKTLTALMLTATLAGSVAAPTQNANAGIIIGVFVPGLITPLIGLAITSAGFFWGIQDEEKMNYKAAALFVLDEKLNDGTIKNALSEKYPGLDEVLSAELAKAIVDASAKTEKASDGFKHVVISESSIESVLSVLAATQPELGEQIRNDLTR